MGNLPIGSVLPYLGLVAPVGYVLADGRELDRETYAALFNVIRTDYGSSGPETFQIPDLRGRSLVGAGQNSDPSLSNRDLGTVGGNEQTNSIPANTGLGTETTAGPGNVLSTIQSGGTSFSTYTDVAADTSLAGDSAEGNMPPYGVVNYIMYTGVES